MRTNLHDHLLRNIKQTKADAKHENGNLYTAAIASISIAIGCFIGVRLTLLTPGELAGDINGTLLYILVSIAAAGLLLGNLFSNSFRKKPLPEYSRWYRTIWTVAGLLGLFIVPLLISQFVSILPA